MESHDGSLEVTARRSAFGVGTVQPVGAPVESTSTSKLLWGPGAESWRQHLVSLALVLLDVLLALAVWQVAILLRAFFEGSPVSEATVAGMLPTVAVWVGLRALLGLYPGYGMNPVEELRRQTYAVLATLAITATFVVALQVDDMVSRSVLAMVCLGLVLLAPLVRQLAKWRLMKLRLWGKPVVVFSSGEPGGHVAALLAKEWGLGYKPVAVFGSHPGEDRRHYEASPNAESLAAASRISRRYGVDTVIFAMPHTRREHLDD